MLINELTSPIIEGLEDPHIFKAVFMAGSPGSGKSTIAGKLFSGTGLKYLNVDAFWQLYKSKGKLGDYERYWELYKKQEKNYLDGRLGLVIDGTAKNPEKMAQVKAALESLGYDTAMVFVNTTLETSLDRVARRAQQPGKDFGREIDPEFVKDVWNKTQTGLGALQSLFQSNFFIVDNNKEVPDIKYVQKRLNKWLDNKRYNPIARDWIKQQQALKQQSSPAVVQDQKAE